MNTCCAISLHIGLNHIDSSHYVDKDDRPWDGRLNSCENDAEAMYNIASALNYSCEILRTKHATRQAVIDKITAAAVELHEGDIFLLTYSGHGGQVKDLNADEDDGADETWCLYDAQIIDDELALLWTKFRRGVRIFVLSDSCHSGSSVKSVDSTASELIRTDGLIYKFVPWDFSVATYRKNKQFYNDIAVKTKPFEPKIEASGCLISACMDNEYATDGTPTTNSLFTQILLEVWAEGGFAGTYVEFHQTIVKKMPAFSNQQPNYLLFGSKSPVYSKQRPFQIFS